MSAHSFSNAIAQVMGGNAVDVLSSLETSASLHSGWAAPVVALAVAAERIGDWDSAFELWTQARLLLPNSPVVDEGVRTSSLEIMKQKYPQRHAVAATEAPAAEAVSEIEAVHEVETVAEAQPVPDVDEESSAESRWGPVSEPGETENESGKSPAPLIQPFDFDLTEFSEEAGQITDEVVNAVEKEVSDISADKTLDELDQLIGRLEGARIIPREDADNIPAPQLDADIDEVVSETLATIYMNQEQFVEAARMFERLAQQHPERADEFLGRAEEARSRESK